ncbi:MAG: hypothetical protein IKD59_05305 [Lachnospiraceae bacterium]|nr:hypothetical protein [Lachnospiraceae bacterium]
MARKNADNDRISELKQIYAPLSEEKKALAYPLIENLVFIEEQMEELQAIIRKEGCSDEYKNGNNQFGKKQSANLQAYNALVKSYNMINTRLEGMLPAKQSKSKLDELMNE